MIEHTASTAGGGQDWTYDNEWDYDRVYSWMLGAELNQPWYSEGGRAQKYALWSMAKSVVLYPSVFASPALARGQNSTHYMEHFVAYLQGAAMNETVNPTPDNGCMPWDNELPPYPPAAKTASFRP